MKIQDLRRSYTARHLSLSDLATNPLDQFRKWFDEIQTSELPEWFEKNAMTLATGCDNHVASRIVLLKQFDQHGFYFFTNYDSDKSKQIDSNNRVALNFYWPFLERQVRIEGVATRTDRKTSEEYFHSRPRDSQAGAIVSDQSSVIAETADLESVRDRLLASHDPSQNLPCPDNWGGWCVKPSRYEFWQGRPSRLHDRFRYRLDTNQTSWIIERLAP